MAAFRLSGPTDSPTDRELIARTLAGDGEAFAILVGRYQRKIYRVACAIVRDDTDAAAITQDTFVLAYTNLSKFEGRSELETWLTRIAINQSRDVLRRRKIARFFSFGEEEEGGPGVMFEPVDDRPDAERQLMAVQLRAAITRAERRLSSQQKVIFRLRHYEQLSLEAIAQHLGLRPGTVRAHLFRAVHKIREELSAWRNRTTGDDDEAL